MDFSSIIYTIGATGIFPSRAFMPAFFTALMLRFGPEISAWAGVGLIPKEPVHCWFTSDASLIILGVLMVLEFFATKDADIRQTMDEVDHWIKSGMVLLTTIGVLSASDIKTIQAIQQASPWGNGLLAVAAGGTVFFLTSVRQELLEVLVEADADDSLGLQHLLMWCENVWVCLALILLFVVPIIMLVLLVIVVGFMLLIRKLHEWHEEKEKLACGKCSAKIYPCAKSCPECKQPHESPCSIGLLGTSKPGTTADLETHAFRLLEKKRCPECATRLHERHVSQTCPACGTRVFDDNAKMIAYDDYIQRRFKKTMVIVTVLGLIPVIGLVIGVIWYRIQLVAPYRRYLPRFRCFWMRMLLKFIKLLLLIVQWIPVLGWFSLPLMAWISQAFYRRTFLGHKPTSDDRC
jgi:putative Mn2+ efflux pump MntP